MAGAEFTRGRTPSWPRRNVETKLRVLCADGLKHQRGKQYDLIIVTYEKDNAFFFIPCKPCHKKAKTSLVWMSTQCMRQHVQELKNGRRPHKDVSSSRILGLVLTWLLKTAPIKTFLNADISKWIEVNRSENYKELHFSRNRNLKKDLALAAFTPMWRASLFRQISLWVTSFGWQYFVAELIK